MSYNSWVRFWFVSLMVVMGTGTIWLMQDSALQILLRKSRGPSFFDKAVILVTGAPVWAGTYDRAEYRATKEIPPNPVYHGLCPEHGFFKGVLVSRVGEKHHEFGIRCRCGYFHQKKHTERNHTDPTQETGQ